MADLSLRKSGVIQITSSDTSPKDITLASAIKTGSSHLTYGVKDRRAGVFVQQGSIAITNSDAGPTKDSAALATAVDVTCSYVVPGGFREKRGDGYSGVTLKLQSSTVVRATFHQPASGDLIDVDFTVVEVKPRRGATLRILDDETLRAEWDGTLVAGETIDIAYELIDLDAIGNMLLELDFKAVQAVAVLCGNMLQDLIVADTVGNIVSYRIRLFDTRENAEAATADVPDGSDLEPGELKRITRTQQVSTSKNDRTLLLGVVTDIADTPGVD